MSRCSVTKRLEIDAGHRLLNHEGQCRNLHGHRYAFEVTCVGDLDAVGRVVDFAVVKERIGGWLARYWDHAYIAQEADPLLVRAGALGLRTFILPVPPTAENLAAYLYRAASTLLGDTGVTVTKVRCWETPTSWADYPGAP